MIMKKYIPAVIRGIIAGAMTILLGWAVGFIFSNFYVSDLHLIWQVCFWSLLVFVPFSICRIGVLFYHKVKKHPKDNRKFWNLLDFVLTYIFSVIWQALILDNFETHYALVYGSVIAFVSAIFGIVSWYDSKNNEEKKSKKRSNRKK